MVLVADSFDELVECVMHHSVQVHHSKETEEARHILRQSCHDGNPSEKVLAAQFMTIMAMRSEAMK